MKSLIRRSDVGLLYVLLSLWFFPPVCNITVISDCSLARFHLCGWWNDWSYLHIAMSITPNNSGGCRVQEQCVIRLHAPSSTFISTRCHAVQLRGLTHSARGTRAGQGFGSISLTPAKASLFKKILYSGWDLRMQTSTTLLQGPIHLCIQMQSHQSVQQLKLY